MHKVISSVLSPDSSTVNSMVFSTDGISFIGAHGTTPTGQPASQHKLVFEVKHYGLKKQQKWKPVCTICRKGFKSWKEQAEHWKCKHAAKDEFKCNECQKEFGLASNYKKHVLLHEEEKKKFVCDECGQRFTYPSQLNSHA